jgi:hypothetical protein
VIASPTANQVIAYPAPVTLNVQRASGCSAAIDGVAPSFQLEWQYFDFVAGQWTDASILPTFDGAANPNGVPVAASTLVDTYGFAQWRVRARLVKLPQTTPWSAWTAFSFQ